MSTLLRGVGTAGFLWVFACAASASPSVDAALLCSDWTEPCSLPAIVTLASCLRDGEIELASQEEAASEARNVDQGADILRGMSGYEPTCSVSAGVVILHRSRPDGKLIIRQYGGTTQISGGEDFDFDWGAGPELTIARRMANGDFWEVRYFNDLEADPSKQYGNPINFQLGNFANISAIDLSGHYTTTLHSTEANWHRPWGDRCSLLAGFRWLELQDRLAYAVTFPTFDAEYNWNEHNHLYGGQIGTDFDLSRRDNRLKINAVMKAGIFGTVADNDFSLEISNAAPFDGGDRGSKTAFVGEIDLTGAYLITSHIAVHAGYQLLWINNVALASDQAAAATANFTQDAIDVDGKLFYHGATTGVDFVW